MDNKEFLRLLSDTKENLNQLNKMVKDNISAQELIFDNSFDSLLKQNDSENKTVENKPIQEVNPASAFYKLW
jgi:hypothetical protein